MKSASKVPREVPPRAASRREEAAAAPAARPAGELPLTASQSLLWLEEQVRAAAPAHHLVLTLALEGPLDPAQLAKAWAATVAARDALRMTVDPARPVQRPLDVPPPALERLELARPALEAWLAERSLRPLPAGGPRWEAALVRLGPAEHVFHLRADPALLDARSLRLVAEDLGARYGGAPPAPAPSFRDLLATQARRGPARETAARPAAQPQGSEPLRPYGMTPAGGGVDRVAVAGDAGLAARLSAAAGRDCFRGASGEASHLAVLATAVAAWVARVAGRRELVLRLAAPERPPGHERTCGGLTGRQLLRLTAAEDDTFATLGARVRDALAEAPRGGTADSFHGVDHVAVELSASGPVAFAGLRATARVRSAAAVADGAADGDGGAAPAGEGRCVLGVRAAGLDGAAPLELLLELPQAALGPATRRRAGGHLLRVLEALAEDPGARLDAAELVGDDERRAIEAAGTGPAPGSPAPDLVEALAAQARRRPDHPAVVGPDATLTYAALEACAGRLAFRLRSLGVGPEVRVGVAVPRGAGELVALLATLRAGGAFVPLDPSHPLERRRAILRDAAPGVLIAPAASDLASALPPGARLLVCDDPVRAGDGFEPLPLAPPRPEALAYVLFTSGSTGRPKGVEIPRGALANLLRATARAPGLGEDDRLLAVSTTTFDMSELELFLPLYVGATAVIADRETATDPALLRRRLEEARITVLQATPAMWRLLVGAGWRGDPRLRALIGGEALDPELAAALLERCGELWNLYGPTEATVWATGGRIDRGDARITVGRPLDAARVLVLDPALRPVPVGAVGEIHIGGAGLARGYAGRPDLTRARFVPDPGRPGERLYRTGDLGRLLEDGRLECLGRTDQQVKLRGFRIELGEIEAVLRAVPGVAEAAAVALGQGEAQRLVVYWTGPAERQALLDEARARLPRYMVPSALVHLAAFPLTPSGKLDRRALPAPGPEAPAADEPLRAPASALEARLAAIWSDVLGVSPVGADQDLFALGGSSISAIQIRARVEAELGVELPLRTIFEAPTVQGLARGLGVPGDRDAPIVFRLRRGHPDLAPLFCLYGVDQYAALARALDGGRGVVSVHVPIRAPAGPRRRWPAIREMARRYVEIIRATQPRGPYRLAGLCLGGILAFEAARQLEAAGQEVALVGVFDGYLPRALRIAQGERLADYLRRAAAAPLDTARRLAERAAGSARSARAALRRRTDLTSEIGLDEPELEEDALRRYQGEVGPVRAHLMVFSATHRPFASWQRVDPALGWEGLAARLTIRVLDCGHLEMLRGAWAGEVARALEPALRD